MTNRMALKETTLLNYTHPNIQTLIKSSGWRRLDPYHIIGAVYEFVRDGIKFGYNDKDTLKASEVLSQGIGQCNTKAVFLMALLRALDIPCKIEAFHVDASFQKELLPPLLRKLSPKHFLHTSVLVEYDGSTIALEGHILDYDFLEGLHNKFPQHEGSFYGYGVATKDFNALNINWNGKDTYIQKQAITKSLGVYDTPDAVFEVHGQVMGKIKTMLYRYSIRHLMNQRVQRIRNIK